MKVKDEARRRFRDLLKSDLQSETRAERTSRLNAQLVSYLKTLSHGPSQSTWAAYQPFGFEVDIRPALSEVSNQINWVYPRIDVGSADKLPNEIPDKQIQFYRLRPDSKLKLNQWNILEPDPASADLIRLGELAGLLIPGLAFDYLGHRLGRGGGYYDRLLAEPTQSNPHVIKVGVALDLQVLQYPSQLVTEEFDQPVDLVITEARKLDRIHAASATPLERKSS